MKNSIKVCPLVFLVINVCNHGEHYETPCINLPSALRLTSQRRLLIEKLLVPQIVKSLTLYETRSLTTSFNIIPVMCSKMILQCLLQHLHNSSIQKYTIIRQASYTSVGTLIVATIYLQLIQNWFMFRSFTVLQCSHQHCVQPVASDVEVVGYL